METILAEHRGFCYGVKRAIDMAEKCAAETVVAHTIGPIIHNPQVVERLRKQGIIPVDLLAEITHGAVIIRSHGVGPQIYKEAEERGLKIIDATCPHVKQAQQAAHKLLIDGYTVVVVGERHHPEVKSIVEWTDGNAVIVETIDDAIKLEHIENMGIVVQTTFSADDFDNILKVLRNRCDNINIQRTICTATSMRQKSAADLATNVDVMIVIGGKNSANTTHLADICRQSKCSVKHIETYTELNSDWFIDVNKVGITAGASTPDWIIEEVVQKMEEMGNWLEEFDQLERGTIVKGKVISITRDEVFVDIGYKGEGVITLKELAYPVPDDAREILVRGQEIDVYVLNADNTDGPVALSKIRADKSSAWQGIEDAAKNESPIDVLVVEVVKGGLAVAIDGVRGFIPASQIALRFVDNISEYVGKTLKAIPIEVDSKKQRVVLSGRLLLEKERKANEEAVFANIKQGDLAHGVVQRLTNFGAFVDIGGVDGLIHISDLAWERVKDPAEILSPGDKVEVFVLKVDPLTKRIALSLKQTLRDPWLDKIETLVEGSVVDGVVANTAQFGAFVKLDCGIEGLVHLSELSERHVAKAGDVVKPAQTVKVKVIKIDRDNKRIALSIKQVQEKQEQDEYQEYLERQKSETVSE